MNWIEFNFCLACSGNNLKRYLDLGEQPLANDFRKHSVYDQEAYPLQVNFCEDCGHSQLSGDVDAKLKYSNYLYVSGTTETLKNHFKDLVNYLLPERFSSHYLSRVLDIGSNDGSLLSQFKGRVEYVQGVDPAENLAKFSKEKGIPVLVDFWNSNTAFKLNGNFSIICALNCLAHQSNPYDFLKGCTRVLTEKGRIVIEFPYFPNTLKINDFGQIYHEHLSLFTIKSFIILIERLNLRIDDLIFFPEIHGGTMRFVLKKGLEPHSEKVKEYIRQEMKDNLHSIEPYYDFSKRITSNIKELWNVLVDMNKDVICYGASAKSSTLLNSNLFYYRNSIGFGKGRKIKYVVDDNPLKVGKLTPGSGISIKASEELKKEKDPVIVLTTHNFKREIVQKLKNMGIHGTLINYTPMISMEKF